MDNTRYPLYQIILSDLFGQNKTALLLLCLVIGSGFSAVWITHQTRLLVSEQEFLNDQNMKLDNQYINLKLEENTQSKNAIVEAAADKLGLLPIVKEREMILTR